MDNKVRHRLDQQTDKNGPLIPGMTRPCWIWKGAFDNQGFPRFWYNGTTAYANRVRFVMEGVPIGPEDHVVTLCRNRSCVRPAHHVLGTELDAQILGCGGRMGPGDQYIMRMMYENGEIQVGHIALSYGISPHVAEAILLEGGLDIKNPTCTLPVPS